MAVTPTSSISEQALVDAAERGDEAAFRRLVENHRAELFAHCYRMLASLEDAEDALQETLVRVWRGLPTFAGRSSLRTWLYKVATNACLDAIARRPKRVLPVDFGPASTLGVGDDPGAPLVESVWIEPYPDEALALPHGHAAPDARYEQREAVELAFIAALQHLPANQRAVLILREVLGFSAREVSESLDTSIASVNSALQRARKAVEERLPERTQQATLRAVGDHRVRDLVQRYVDAWARGDVDALRAILAEDVVFSMPPWSSWWRGRELIAAFATHAVETCEKARTIPVTAAGQPALAYYELVPETGRSRAAAIDVLTIDGGAISAITAFVWPELFPWFGLPLELGADEQLPGDLA